MRARKGGITIFLFYIGRDQNVSNKKIKKPTFEGAI